MDTLKTAIVVILLLAVLYIVYVVLNKPETPLPDGVAWDGGQSMEPLTVDMGSDPFGDPTASPGEAVSHDAIDNVPSFSEGGSFGADAAGNSTFAGGVPSTSPPPPPPIQSPETDGSGYAAPHTSGGAAPELLSTEAVDESAALGIGDSSAGAAESSYAATAAAAMSDGGSANGETTEVGLPDSSAGVTDVSGVAAENENYDRGGNFAQSSADLAGNTQGFDQPPMDDRMLSGATNTTNDQPAGRLADSAIQSAREQMGREEYFEALLTLSYAYKDPEVSDAERDEMHALVDPLAAKVVYSREHLMEPAHTVKDGETLLTIAEQYDIPWQLLANINGIEDPQALNAGQQLKVVRGPFHAEVDLQSAELTLFVQRLYAGRFPIRVGQNTPAPAEYSVQDKQPGQTYYAGDARTLAADDPRNPYGGIWIDLGSNVCIHAEPQQADAPSFGCIGLTRRDANDVFAMLSRGSSVVVRR